MCMYLKAKSSGDGYGTLAGYRKQYTIRCNKLMYNDINNNI